MVLPPIPSFNLCTQEIFKEVKLSLVCFPQARIIVCAGTGVSLAQASSTRTTNPRQVENTTFQDTKAKVVQKCLFINIFTPQMRHQSLSLLHINIPNDFLYL